MIVPTAHPSVPGSLPRVCRCAVIGRNKGANGVTLVELMLVIALGSILLAIAVPSYRAYVLRSQNSRAISDLGTVKMAIDKYRLNYNDGLPASLADTSARALTDPWGNPYVYTVFANLKGNGFKRKDRNLVPINSEYDLYSKGPDGESVAPLTAPKSQDDVIMANDGGFIGKASAY
jgi:general secretion pathway protein G